MAKSIKNRRLNWFWLIVVGLWATPLLAQQPTGWEYWFDQNFSNRINTPLSTNSINETVSTSDLSDGVHIFNMRLQRGGVWGSVSSQIFIKNSQATSEGFTAYEYWFDQSFQTRTNIPLSISSINETISTSNLPDGVHVFNMRLQRGGVWGSVSSQLFIKNSQATGEGFTAYEYWIDNNFNSRIKKTISSALDSLVFNDNINIDTLCREAYAFNIRFLGKNGWSAVKRDTFFKETYSSTQVMAKYIYHTEPQTLSVSFTDSSKNVVSRVWDFGDGKKDTLKTNPTYVYSRAGIYKVCLTCKNRLAPPCGVDSFCQNVVIKGITGISPNRASNSSYAITTLSGFGLNRATKVELFRNTDIIKPDSIIFVDSSRLKVNFRFDNSPVGKWSLRAIDGRDTFIIRDTFTIELSRRLPPEIVIIGPGRILRGREFDYQVVVKNPGNEPLVGVDVLITVDTSVTIRVVDSLDYTFGNIPRNVIDSIRIPTNFFVYDDTSLIKPLKVCWLMIPYLPADATGTINIKATSNIATTTDLDVSVSQSLLSDSTMASIFQTINSVICPTTGDECYDALIGVGYDYIKKYAPIPFPISCGLKFRDIYCDFRKALKDDNVITKNIKAVDIGATMASILIDCLPGGRLAKKLGYTGGIEAALKKHKQFNKFKKPALITYKCFDKIVNKAKQIIQIVTSLDPNLKEGIKGINNLNCVNTISVMPYNISFENADSALAPASEVRIYDTLDKTKFQINSFRFTGFGFGSNRYYLPKIAKSFVREIDLRPSKNIILRVTGDVDSNGIVNWYFGSLDPRTTALTQNIDNGFLPPNKRKPEGEGYVNFEITPIESLQHLTTISNKASIVFDYETPVITPTWRNTVDKVLPQSRVLTAEKSRTENALVVRWSGTDTHAGILDYFIYVSEDNGPYQAWLQGISSDSAYFVGRNSSRYAFYSVARDYVGNIENKTPTAEVTATFTVATREVNADKLWLGQNRPNPFSNTTTIDFNLDKAYSQVELKVFDVVGQSVFSIKKGALTEGVHSIDLDLSNLAAGVYFYQLNTDGRVQVRKMTLIK
ncbi:MAG: T9SS type A sorting domain-containing protein [Saprospiraceae bacterium]|nr:T9SS type A sorting domain-containing protein [Saprospiraceae bacterium]